MSAVESRFVRMLTRDPEMIRLARVRPDECDIHRLNAADIFHVSAADVTKEQRYFAKKTEHGAQRGMHGQKMSDELLKDGIIRTPDECERMLEAYHARNPAIEGVYFKEVRTKLLRYKALANTWGRVWRCEYERLSDELYRQAYSFLPQSEASDLLMQWGLKPLWRWLSGSPKARINVTVHDSLLVSVEPEFAYDVAITLRGWLERPRVIAGQAFVVPVEFKLGSTWAGDFEFRRLPPRAEFLEKAMACEAKVRARVAA